MWFKASAPGSLMLLGEYGVLHGEKAIVCAIDKRITVTLTPRADSQIQLHSALGHLTVSRKKIPILPPFQFVLATLKQFQKKLPVGCDIEIQADFSAQVGFASSAAVTIATLSVLNQWLQLSLSEQEQIYVGRQIIRKVQGMGSGADIAAAVMGGVVAYRTSLSSLEKLADLPPISVIYSGSKTPTPQVVAMVENTFSTTPLLLRRLYQAIGQCAEQGQQAIAKKNWSELGHVMRVQQGLMIALGVNNAVIDNILLQLAQEPNVLGAKISGSGKGDCVIALGEITANLGQIPVTLTQQGVYCEQG